MVAQSDSTMDLHGGMDVTIDPIATYGPTGVNSRVDETCG